MDETRARGKVVYSRNEKIVRIISLIGIILSAVVGIMLFPIGKVSGGIIVLVACAIAAFLVSGFFIKKVKKRFGEHRYKRFIYAGVYAFIMMLSMLTAALVSYFSTYPIDDLANEAVTYTEDAIKGENVTIQNMDSMIFEYFESGDSYYYAIETDFEVVGTGGAVLKRSTNTYLKINKYTATITVIESLQYEVAKSYT